MQVYGKAKFLNILRMIWGLEYIIYTILYEPCDY